MDVVEQLDSVKLYSLSLDDVFKKYQHLMIYMFSYFSLKALENLMMLYYIVKIQTKRHIIETQVLTQILMVTQGIMMG